MSDPTDPEHYRALDPEPFYVIRSWGLTYALGNVVKYVARESRKGGLDDLKKARRYLDLEIEARETNDQAIDHGPPLR